MSILWCGGEDIDFPNGIAVSVDLNPIIRYRPAYARCSLYEVGNGALARSVLFGPVTSVWVTAQLSFYDLGLNLGPTLFGLGKSGTGGGIFIGNTSKTVSFLVSDLVSYPQLGVNVGDGNKLSLYKCDGTTVTRLGSEVGYSIADYILYRLDMQIVGIGLASTINVYWDGALVISFSGDASMTGIANLDSVCSQLPFIQPTTYFSEVIVTDEDTRAMSLCTLPPAGPGTTENWTGAYTDINEIAIDDATVVTTNNPASEDWQATLGPLVAGGLGVRALMIAARTASPAGSAATKVGLGVNSGGTVNSGALQAPVGASWTTLERLMPLNPITGLAWTAADVNALQLNLRSGS
jgi:hypothetical protein